MKTTPTNRKQGLPAGRQGFTIIEVMIVLTIAGLILLIVFLAVPALQRNSRNTQRKNDVAAALAAVSDFQSNNAGQIPAVACGSGGNYTVSAGTCASPTGAAASFKLGYYTAAPTLVDQSTYTAPSTVTDTLYMITGAKCGTAPAVSSGSARQVVAVYAIESGGSLAWTCQES